MDTPNERGALTVVDNVQPSVPGYTTRTREPDATKRMTQVTGTIKQGSTAPGMSETAQEQPHSGTGSGKHGPALPSSPAVASAAAPGTQEATAMQLPTTSTPVQRQQQQHPLLSPGSSLAAHMSNLTLATPAHQPAQHRDLLHTPTPQAPSPAFSFCTPSSAAGYRAPTSLLLTTPPKTPEERVLRVLADEDDEEPSTEEVVQQRYIRRLEHVMQGEAGEAAGGAGGGAGEQGEESGDSSGDEADLEQLGLTPLSLPASMRTPLSVSAVDHLLGLMLASPGREEDGEEEVEVDGGQAVARVLMPEGSAGEEQGSA